MRESKINRVIIKSPLRISLTFLWIGFVCAISFMEAWLKFRAPDITIPLGLGIGRLVFGALNKVEIVFALSMVISSIADKNLKERSLLALSIPLLVLLLQSTWLLPALDARAELIIQGTPPPFSHLHLLYIVMENIKVICLFIYGVMQFKTREI